MGKSNCLFSVNVVVMTFSLNVFRSLRNAQDLTRLQTTILVLLVSREQARKMCVPCTWFGAPDTLKTGIRASYCADPALTLDIPCVFSILLYHPPRPQRSL